MLNFKNALVSKEVVKSNTYKLVYDKDKWLVNVGNRLIPIDDKYCHIDKHTKFIYSLPCNDKHPAWTKRNFKYIQGSNTKLAIIETMWCKFYNNQRIGGTIRDGRFYPNL